MFERILCATDFSRSSEATTALIPGIPTAKEVVLTYVIDPADTSYSIWIPGRPRAVPKEAAEAAMAKEKQELLGAGLAVTEHVAVAEGGNIAGAILAVAQEVRPSLIVMGARGRTIISDFFLGSVSAGVLERARTHMLIARATPEGADPFSRVLCPVDFSKPSLQVLSMLRRLRVPDVVLVHVVAGNGEAGEAVRDAEARLQDLKNTLEAAGVRVETRVARGQAVEGICTAAEESGATLIMLPRLGRTDYITNKPIGSVAAGVAKQARHSVCVIFPALDLEIAVRELNADEFPLAEKIWTHYHQQTGDPERDRIFGVFVEGSLVSVARCRAHPDGLEVDGVFTPTEYRGRGYAKRTVDALVAACGNETLYMHSTLELVTFYGSFGFVSIPEDNLPPTIRARFDFALGDMKSANVQPMMRPGKTP
ncbi:MAG TPA: GNAT family N-acetyltransferase [Methanofollis liminatans]|uniref:GNAT family N-acetyltransferase n=1 Tax=Methanofollis liminatans TaxID=2201 RepID=A0A831LVK4_9EURY|nr:GNAT family N-acetyltransferase [Methanofollis liminatans]